MFNAWARVYLEVGLPERRPGLHQQSTHGVLLLRGGFMQRRVPPTDTEGKVRPRDTD